MQVLWWLLPPLVATILAMLWVGWAGRVAVDDRDDSDEALSRMEKALARPLPSTRATGAGARRPEVTHGVAMRRAPRTPSAGGGPAQ